MLCGFVRAQCHVSVPVSPVHTSKDLSQSAGTLTVNASTIASFFSLSSPKSTSSLASTGAGSIANGAVPYVLPCFVSSTLAGDGEA